MTDQIRNQNHEQNQSRDHAPSRALYARARKSAAEGRFGDAILYYSEMLQVGGFEEIAYLGRANMRALRGNSQGALDDVDRLLRLPNIKHSTRVLGHVVQSIARWDMLNFNGAVDAIEDAKRAVAPIADADKTMIANLMAQINFHYALTLLEQTISEWNERVNSELLATAERTVYDAKYANSYGARGLASAIYGAALVVNGEREKAEAQFQAAESEFAGTDGSGNYQHAIVKYVNGLGALIGENSERAAELFREGVALQEELHMNIGALIEIDAGTPDLRERLERLRHDPEPRPNLTEEAARDYGAARTRFMLFYGGVLLVLATIFLLLFR